MSTSQNPLFTNHLAEEKSPYLIQHRHNPVDWFPWGEEAFAKARAEEKPIFLSVGYSTCHWCHVMAHESFEDATIAQILNEFFVSIKVDREERPDVDRLYMSFVQATTGAGGWPMSVWLTPELKPFYGGTYFPPESLPNRAGFKVVLLRLAELWKANREKLVTQAERLTESLQESDKPDREKKAPGMESLDKAYHYFANVFDPIEGGFGNAPKFPRPVIFNFLFREAARRGRLTSEGKQAQEMALFTLKKMAAGGMHDHLGGGFHRYSVDPEWHVPHFEKMLYDQAQLACSYLEAFQISGDKIYAETARDVLDYVSRDLKDKAGGFYSAEDADSLIEKGKPEHAEGAFYVWTQKEIAELLGEKEAAVFNFIFDVIPNGNVADGFDLHGEFQGKNILIQRHFLEEAAQQFHLETNEAAKLLDEIKIKLKQKRDERPRPHLDDKIITSWNGLMISAYARAAQIFSEQSYLDHARSAATFLKKELYNSESGRLLRNYRQGAGKVEGFADDYAFLIQGLIDLYEASFEIDWLQWAVTLQEKMDDLFRDEKEGGYFNSGAGDKNLLFRMKEDYDGAEPSSNSIASLNLQRLSWLVNRPEWREQATQIFQVFSFTLQNIPAALPQMLCALDYSVNPPLQAVFTGKPDDLKSSALMAEIHRRFLPNKILIGLDPKSFDYFLGKHPYLPPPKKGKGKVAALICENYACQLPMENAEELKKFLDSRAK